MPGEGGKGGSNLLNFYVYGQIDTEEKSASIIAYFSDLLAAAFISVTNSEMNETIVAFDEKSPLKDAAELGNF